jgi:glyoxylase-like metal-dependent hydrolase (beta-lactamase superfamily II)
MKAIRIALGAAGLLLVLSGAGRALEPAGSAGAACVDVAQGVRLLPGRFTEGAQPDGNTVLLEAPEGLVVIDTGRHPAHTQAILDLARAQGRPVAAVVNTHWHLDHSGGNGRLRRAFPGVPVYGTAAMGRALDGFLAQYKTWLESEVARLAEDSLARLPLEGELAILAEGRALLPDTVVAREGPRLVAGLELQLGLTSRAVTSADLWVFDPATRVLVAGDLVTLPAPLLDTACPEGWERELARLAEVDFALLVPGHGPPLDRAAFEQWRSAYSRLLACAASAAPRDSCAAGWLDDAGALIPDADRHLARSLLDYSIDSLLRADPDRLDRLCGR